MKSSSFRQKTRDQSRQLRDLMQIGWLWRRISQARTHLRRRQVPVLLQLSAVECGAACLAMVLSYYGRQTRVAECRLALDAGRDGVKALALAQTARSFGLRVKAFSLEPSAFKDIPLPAIAHWEFNHFVVVERWSARQVQIIDPAVGRRQMTVAEFDAGFTGVVLTFEPGTQFIQRHATQHASWRTYFQAIWQSPGLLAQILGASLVLQALGLVLPIFTQLFVDRVIPGQLSGIIPILGASMVLFVLTTILISYLRAGLLMYLQVRLDSQLMTGFFEHLLTLPFRFFEQRTSGDLLMRLGSNTSIREILTNQSVALMLDGTLVFVYLGFMFVRQPLFGAIVLGIGALQIAISLGTNRRVRALAQRELSARTEEQSYLVEALNGIATVKVAGSEDRVFDYWSNLFFKQLNVSLQRSHQAILIETAMTGIRMFAPLLLLWLGVQWVINGSMSLGAMLALNALAVMFLTPLASLVQNVQRLQLAGAQLERLADVLEAAPEQHPTTVQAAPPLNGRIEMSNVSFRYDADAPLVLHDINLTIEPGQHVALVGRTGSGKSTLARLLLGLYTPTAGQISYDDLPLQQLNYRTLRSQFGAVLQEVRLFSGSIRQNIAFNNPAMPLEQVIAAAQCAAIHEDILAMPMGYETLVSENGGSLSGGQRQRLALARALAHQPGILLLDEATSHLDVETERQIDQHLQRLACTRIVVAHRLSTVRHADLILVVDQGRVVERGTHTTLMASGGYYAALVCSQMDSPPANTSPSQLQV